LQFSYWIGPLFKILGPQLQSPIELTPMSKRLGSTNEYGEMDMWIQTERKVENAELSELFGLD